MLKRCERGEVNGTQRRRGRKRGRKDERFSVIGSVVLCVDSQNRRFIIHFGETDASVVRTSGIGKGDGWRVAKKGSGREGWISKFISGRGRCPLASSFIYFLVERVPRLKSREQKSPWRQRNSILMNLLCFSYRVPRAQPSYSTAGRTIDLEFYKPA